MSEQLREYLDTEPGIVNVIERPCGCVAWYESRVDEEHERRCDKHVRGFAR